MKLLAGLAALVLSYGSACAVTAPVVPSRLGFVKPPLTQATTNTCNAVKVQTLGGARTEPTPVLADTKINIRAGSPAGIKIWSEATCHLATAFIMIPKGQSLGTFYINSAVALSAQVTIDGNGLAGQSETVKFVLPPPPPPPSCSDTGGQPAIPPQASAAGFNNVTFYEGFDGPIDPAKWTAVGVNSSQYTIANGCINVLTDTSGYSDAFTSKQLFQHGYFEASMRFEPTGFKGKAWPAFWLFANEGFGTIPVGTKFGELDVIEAYAESASAWAIIMNVHEWTSSANQNTDKPSAQNNGVPTIPAGFDWTQFHKWGVLWEANSVKWFIDGQQVLSAATGPGTQFPSIEMDHMFLIFGTGKDWPVQFRYILTVQ